MEYDRSDAILTAILNDLHAAKLVGEDQVADYIVDAYLAGGRKAAEAELAKAIEINPAEERAAGIGR